MMIRKMGVECGWNYAAVLLSATILLFVCLPPITTAQSQYCSITRDHTLCKFQGLGPRCKGIMERGIPSQDQQTILHMHNYMRQLVATGNERRGRPGPQPSASNMRQLEWDDELAAMAQRLADQCKYTHDCLTCRKTDRFLTGQNLYQFSENLIREGSDWPKAINAWYDEVADWSPSKIDRFEFIKALGHYTQIAWADTYRMGCGYAFYNEGKWNRKLYICNYGPAGNVITTPMYLRGAPCSACPEGTQCSNQYPGLCTSNTGYQQFYSAVPSAPPAPLPVPQVSLPPTTKYTTTTPTPTTTTTRRSTTTRTTTTTTTPLPFYNEIESNDIYDIENRFGFPSRKNSRRNNPRTTTTTTAVAPTTRTAYQVNRFSTNNNQYNRQTTTTTTTTRRPNNYYNYNNNNNYYQQQRQQPQYTTTRRTTTLPPTTTVAPYASYQYQSNDFNGLLGGSPAIESQLLATLRPASNRLSSSASSSAQVSTLRLSQSPVTGVQDMNSILLFCDFDYAKCPIRFTGDSWNYTIAETSGFGRGFETVVTPGHLTNLYIRSIMQPNGDGNICLHFRYINYRFSPDGTPAKSGNQPLSVRVTAGTLRQKPQVVELSDQSTNPRDWLTARIQFRNIRSVFLLIFQLPTNNLVDAVYLAIDDVLVTKGLCH